ncbi:MAG: hypothetical protein M0R80_26140 [Proteobacteria bacterium]|jgi:hypothetical protein|nr:hypothetical protein [Pseudomonadota bacterium]
MSDGKSAEGPYKIEKHPNRKPGDARDFGFITCGPNGWEYSVKREPRTRVAAEIECHCLNSAWHSRDAEVDALRKENERLRELCEDIVEAWRWKNDNPYPGITDETFGDRITKLRKAIAQTQPQGTQEVKP